MDFEDDDLVALRTAALASLSAKPDVSSVDIKQPEDEDDLESLRLAALMTRKQNQRIQVIYQNPSFLQQIVPHNNFRKNKARVHTNLISLTPDPQADPIPVKPRMISMQKREPIAKSSVADNKVSNKFSRYDSDSSSDEDEEHTVKKPSPGDGDGDALESDAESVTSDRSFSSASEIYQEEPEEQFSQEDSGAEDEKVVVAEQETGEVQKEAGSHSVVKVKEEEDRMEAGEEDNISISGGNNEEDDILAAIDDFLEDKPEKSKPKDDMRKPGNTSVWTGKKSSKTDDVMGNNELKHDASNGKRNQHRNHTESSEGKLKTPTGGKLQRRKREEINKSQFKKVVAESRKENARSRSNESMSNKAPTDSSTIVKEYKKVPTVEVPSPPRERRDSDLDSVGTSDLSFISSDSENEKASDRKKNEERTETKPTQQRRSQKSYLASEDKVRRAYKDKTEARHNEGRHRIKTLVGDRPELKSRSSSRSRSQNNGANETVPKGYHRSSERAANSKKSDERTDASNKDLRKKLEVKGLKRKQTRGVTVDNRHRSEHKGSSPKTQHKDARLLPEQPSSSSEVIESMQTVRRSGIISLKKKVLVLPQKSSDVRKSKSKEQPSNSPALPDLQETRRIIITRPNDLANSKSLHSQSRGRKTDKNSDSKADIQKPKASRKHRARSPDEQPLRRKQRSVLPLKTTDPEKRLIIKELDAVEQLQERERKSRHRRKSHSENNKKDVSSEDETDVEKEEVFAVGQSSFPEYDEILGNVDALDGEYDAESRGSYEKEEQDLCKNIKREKKLEVYKHASDRRRFVPKSSPERSSPEASESRITARGKMLSVHQRLGLLSKHRNLASVVQDRSGDPSKSKEQITAKPIETKREKLQGNIEKKNLNAVAKNNKSSWRSWSDVDSSMEEEMSFNETSNKPKEKRVQRQKRKIEISGKNSSSTTNKANKRDVAKDDENKKLPIKNRLGMVSKKPVIHGRRIVQSSVWVPDAENNLTEKRKKRKRERKTSSSLTKDIESDGGNDDELEARIRRIKEQNGLIMRRQKEIEREKEIERKREKFGL